MVIGSVSSLSSTANVFNPAVAGGISKGVQMNAATAAPTANQSSNTTASAASTTKTSSSTNAAAAASSTAKTSSTTSAPAAAPSSASTSSQPASSGGSHGGAATVSISSAAAAALASSFTMTVGGKEYSASVMESGGQYVADVPGLASATGTTEQVAENNLDAQIDMMA